MGRILRLDMTLVKRTNVMRWTVMGSIIYVVVLPLALAAAQIIAGTEEDKLFRRVQAEGNPDKKLGMLIDFEKQFSASKALPDVYLMMIDIYRGKNDRTKIIEYGEKVLKTDADNVTAMMVLSRNYAIEKSNIERAMALAQRAVDRVGQMKSQPTPPSYSEAQWKDYIHSTETAARGILEYVRTVKGR